MCWCWLWSIPFVREREVSSKLCKSIDSKSPSIIQLSPHCEVTSGLGRSVHFDCCFATHCNIQWLVNGTLLEYLDLVNMTVRTEYSYSCQGRMCFLLNLHICSCYLNHTTIQCVVTIRGGITAYSSIAALNVQG